MFLQHNDLQVSIIWQNNTIYERSLKVAFPYNFLHKAPLFGFSNVSKSSPAAISKSL